MSLIELLLSLYSAWAISAFFWLSAFGRPPILPLARPASVLSLIISCSNSARAPKIWKMSLPPLVVVSMLSVMLLNPMFLLLRLVIVSIKCFKDLPSRSSFQTTRISLPAKTLTLPQALSSLLKIRLQYL
jgi:hypothetical protein